jgi:hypothetical protein
LFSVSSSKVLLLLLLTCATFPLSFTVIYIVRHNSQKSSLRASLKRWWFSWSSFRSRRNFIGKRASSTLNSLCTFFTNTTPCFKFKSLCTREQLFCGIGYWKKTFSFDIFAKGLWLNLCCLFNLCCFVVT